MSLALHSLIHSLSRSEKRYIRLRIVQQSQKGRSNLEELFDLLLKEEKYSEAVLKSIVQGFSWRKQLAETKYQLYRWLLRQLRAYHDGFSPSTRIRTRLNEVEILFAKGLHQQARAILDKIHRLARENEYFKLVLEILSLKVELVDRGILSWEDEASLQAEMRDMLKRFERLSTLEALYRELRRKVFGLGFIRDSAGLEQLKVLFDHFLLKDVTATLSIREEIYYHRAFALYHRSSTDFAGLISDCREVIRLLEQHPGLQAEMIAVYAECLTNQLYGVCWHLRVDEISPLLSKLEAMTHTHPELGSLHFSNYYHMQLNILLYFGEFEHAEAWAAEVRKLLPKYRKALPHTYFSILYFNMAHSAFGIGDFGRALRLLDRNLAGEFGPVQDHLYAMIRIFYLVTLYESGNELILPYSMRSVYRALASRNRIFRFEKIIFTYLRKFLREANPSNLRDLFKGLRDALLPLKENPIERIALENFNITAWLTSKIEGVSFSQALIEERGGIRLGQDSIPSRA